jgi:pimeloyl-ACP methyl ester carboxylesterase
MQTIFRRRVYYLGGFDPRGPSHYHALYKQQAAEQSKITGMKITVGDRQRVNAWVNRWNVRSRDNGHVVDTDYQFLGWDDIIRQHWHPGPLKLLRELAYSFRVYIGGGLFGKLMKMSGPPTIAGLFPLLFIILVPVLGLGAVYGIISATKALQLPLLAGVVLVVFMMLGLAWLGKKAEQAYNIFWLLRIFSFVARYARGEVAEIDTRVDVFAESLLHAGLHNIDEVLIVGHSVGAMLAISMLARVLEKRPAYGRRRTQLSFLSLGHSLPMVTVHPEAVKFREELLAVANNRKVKWIDFTAPTDGACYALSDPVTTAGLIRSNPQHRHPKLLSPRYVKLFSKETYARIRRDKFRMHFQYLMATELPGDYDYFAITAGGKTLQDRFAYHDSIVNYKQPGIFS